MALAIRETEAGGEKFMTLGSTLLVASKSKAGEWYQITNATCSCPGFRYRGACRHVAAAQLEAETEAVTVERTELQGGGWIVKWFGVWHGGVHYNETDAHNHAQGLREAEDWDRIAWLERHGYGMPIPPTPPPPAPVKVPALTIVGPRLQLVKGGN